MTKIHSQLALSPGSGFSFEAFLTSVADNAASWPALRSGIQDKDTFAIFARFCAWNVLFFETFGFPVQHINCDTSQLKSPHSHTHGPFAFDETTYKTRFETYGASYEVTLIRNFNGHMGYFEDELMATFRFDDKSLSASCDIFNHSPIMLTSDNISPEKHNEVINALAQTLGVGKTG